LDKEETDPHIVHRDEGRFDRGRGYRIPPIANAIGKPMNFAVAE